jgi:hypothetical protein
MSSVNKFGRNIDIDASATADIWDGGHTGDESLIWVAPTQARTHDITSSSASDDGSNGGVGARTIRIYGLTGWSTAEVSEDITMNGTANVATSNAYVCLHRMKVLTKGATNVNAGVITATAQTDGTVTAQIRAGEGQTQMAILGIPSTQTAYMTQLYGNTNNNNARFTLLFNPEPDSELLNFLVKHTWSVLAGGTSSYIHPFNPPKVFEGPGIIKVQGYSGAANTDVSAGFDLIVVNN